MWCGRGKRAKNQWGALSAQVSQGERKCSHDGSGEQEQGERSRKRCRQGRAAALALGSRQAKGQPPEASTWASVGFIMPDTRGTRAAIAASTFPSPTQMLSVDKEFSRNWESQSAQMRRARHVSAMHESVLPTTQVCLPHRSNCFPRAG